MISQPPGSSTRPGLDIILVGDSLGMVVQGRSDTLAVTAEEMLYHLRLVRRAVQSALLVVDMPYGSFHVSPRRTVRNAIALVKEGGAEAVKLEGGRKRLAAIRALLDAEIPVLGHLGLTPQSIHRFGGYKIQGRSMGEIDAPPVRCRGAGSRGLLRGRAGGDPASRRGDC